MRHGGAVRTGGRPGAQSPAPSRSDADLARWGETDEQRAEQAVEALVIAARTLVTAVAPDPDGLGCAAASCRLPGMEHGDLCALAHGLAVLTDTPVVQSVIPAQLALEEFQRAITAAVEAVQRCRVTRHAEGRCRFSPVRGQDGCAAVLRAAHQLG